MLMESYYNQFDSERKPLKVLIGCEESQTVCKAFRALGHEAYSNDIVECSGGHPEWHLLMDVLEVVKWTKWDLAIFHPPCTHLAVSGAKHFKKKIEDGRQQSAIDFFMALTKVDIPKVAIENPVCIMSSVWRKPDQIVQPWMFGDPFTKTTCLWLKNLPLLTPTNIVDKGEFITFSSGKKMSAWYSKGSGNSKLRSKTFEGLGRAMADQWSK